jgi:hypothetical protein
MSELIKQDINFMEYPIWLQDGSPSNKQEGGYIWKDRDGYIFRAGYKFPVKTDYIFLLYFLLESQRNGWSDEIVTSKYKVLKNCSMPNTQQSYNRLEDSLKRWKMVGIEFQGTFYDRKTYSIMNFGIIDDWRIDTENRSLYIKINRFWLYKIKESDFFKYINFTKLKMLKSPLTVRLYEILIKNFQGRKTWAIDAMKLAQKIPMNEKHASHIIPKVQAAVNRINSQTDLKIKVMVQRPARNQATFFFEIEKKPSEKPPLQIPEKTQELPLPSSPELDQLLALLPEQNPALIEMISKALEKHGFEYVAGNIEYTNQKSKTSYQAYLDKTIKENWGKGLKEEKEARQKQEEEKRQREREEEEEWKRKREEGDLTLEQNRQADKYITGLSSSQLEDLEKKAIEKYKELRAKQNKEVGSITERILYSMKHAVAMEHLEKMSKENK